MTSKLATVTASDPVDAILAPTADDFAMPADAVERARQGIATPFTVDLDRMVAYGHVAPWNRCILAPRGAACWRPPKDDDLSMSMQGEAELADGTRIPVGIIPFQLNHANVNLTGPEAVDVMAHTGQAFARVRYGKDTVGIYAAGPILPGITWGQVVTVMAAAQSGDWRSLWPWIEDEGRFRFTGSIAVNVPALPLDRSVDVAATKQKFAVAASAPFEWEARQQPDGSMEVAMVAAKKPGSGATFGTAVGVGSKKPPAKAAPVKKATPVKPAPKPAPASGDGVTVKKGDTLTALAKKLLGDGTRWKELYDANKDVIGKNPDLIKPGQKLKLPGKAKPADTTPSYGTQESIDQANNAPAPDRPGGNGGGPGAPAPANSTPAPSSSSSTAKTDWAAKSLAITANTKTKRQSIYDSFAGQLDALKTDKTPGHAERRKQILAQRSQQLAALRADTKAKREQLTAERHAASTTGRTSAMNDTATAMPAVGDTVTLDDGSTGTVAQIVDDHGTPALVLTDGRVIDPAELDDGADPETGTDPAMDQLPAATTAAACSCGGHRTRTAADPGATDPANTVDAGLGDQSAAADVAAGIQAILARLDSIDAQLAGIDNNAAMAALPAEAARLAAIDEELADIDSRVASLMVVTIEDAPAFRRGDIVTTPTGEMGWVADGEPMAIFGSEDKLVRVNFDMADTDWCEENVVAVPVSQLTGTGKIRETTWKPDDQATIVVDESSPDQPTPPPPAASPAPGLQVPAMAGS